ncbi:MAG: twin-arginine translocase subunit TatC [Desulfohalobiaceae bacterium]
MADSSHSEDSAQEQGGPQAGEQEENSREMGEMGLLEHLGELRSRLFRAIAAAFLGMLACYLFAKQIFDWLMEPLYQALPEGSTMIYTAPHEAFFIHIKTAFVAGIFLTSPYIFYQFWLFIKPGLYPHERKYLIPISFCSAVLFVGGALFGYFVVFPFAYEFFMGFADILISPMITMREGFSFALRILLAFGIVFELPLVIFFLSALGLVNAEMLRKKRKYMIIMAFIVSAVLTPPDLITQAFMAVPLVLLYEIGVLIAVAMGRRKKKKRPGAEENKQEEKEKE